MKLRELHESTSEDGVTIHDDVPGKNGHIEMVKRIIKFKDKAEFIKILLLVLKNSGDESTVKEWIANSRKAGYDYPEFKTIEKSIGKINEGADDGVSVYGKDKNWGEIVKFKDKERFIKLCLQELKNPEGSLGEVQSWIEMSKRCGYDYPEFEIILKSIESDFKDRK